MKVAPPENQIQISMYFAPCFLIFLGLAYGSDVTELTDSNFDDELKDKEFALVQFTAPWCGHCKKLAPEYENAATKLKDNKPPVLLAKVDCEDKGKKSCTEYDIKGYPTLKVFRHGDLCTEFDGERNVDGIITFVNEFVEKPSC